jgi:hypothetical protein
MTGRRNHLKLEERKGKGRETTHTHINLHFRIEKYPPTIRGAGIEAFIEREGSGRGETVGEGSECVVDVHGEKS